jgi:hypothetical protein
VGRFDPKYPKEAIAELYRLVLDADSPRTVPQAVAEIAEGHGIEINRSTAYRHLQRERLRRSTGGDSPLPADLHEALDLMERKLAAALDAELRRVIRAGRHGSKPLDVNRARTIARTIKEMRSGREPRDQPTATPEPDDDPAAENGELGDEAARILAAHESDPLEPEPSVSRRHQRRAEPTDVGASNGPSLHIVDHEAQAQIQTYLDRKATQR